MRRISFAEYLDGVRPVEGEPFWIDQCLYDIPETTDRAIRQAAARGAKAVTLYWRLTQQPSYRRVFDTCKELNLTVVLCYDDFHREVMQCP